MIVLDTNVLSAVMRRSADEAVVAWLDDQPSETLWLTTVTVFEVRFGLELLAGGSRRRSLEDAFSLVLERDFQGRILPFDRHAAEEAATLAAHRRASGRTVDFRDTQIAGIAMARQASIATRNTRHFDDLPIPVINPWNP